MSVRTHRLFLILPVTACLHAASEEGRPDASTTTDDADVCDEEALTSFPDAAPWPDEPPEDCGSFLRETPSCFTSVLPDGIDMPSGWARIGSSAEGLWIEDEGWALLDLPDLGVPHEEMFPVDRLHSSSEKARFETGPHAFWWTGEELIPTEALEGDWLVVSGEDGVGAAKPGAMLRTSGTIRVDRALGTWKDMPTENAPVDGPVLSMALADGNNYAVAIGSRNQRLLSALQLMQDSIEEPLSIGELCDKLDISRRQLERLFSRYLNESPMHVYFDMRLSHAYALMNETGMSVTEIALASGFNSATHFSRQFKRKFGASPHFFRKSWS